MAMRDIDDIAEEYRDQGLQCLGVTTQEAAKDALVLKTMDKLDLSYPTLWHAGEVFGEGKPYPTGAVPTMYIIDREGVVHGARTGSVSAQFLRDELKKLGFE
jgi:peroxiredoxin